MASAMHAARTRLDVAASNLANVSSNGFRRRVARAFLTRAGVTASSVLDSTPGPLKHTGRSFDLAVAGEGAFFVRDGGGRVVAERSASFERDARGRLADERGRVLLGERGPIVVAPDATIDERGVVRVAGYEVATLLSRSGTSLQSGFLEAPNVDAVREMVDVVAAERAFETAEKTLSALDEQRQKNADDVARVKQ
jgi:flagellar basal body rod protein FlgG